MCHFGTFFLEVVYDFTGNEQLQICDDVGINQESRCSWIEIEQEFVLFFYFIHQRCKRQLQTIYRDGLVRYLLQGSQDVLNFIIVSVLCFL